MTSQRELRINVPGARGWVASSVPGPRIAWAARRTMSNVTNLAQNLTDTTRAHGGRVAVRVDNAAMSYRALDEASARVAGLLHERGLKPGDRVGIMMPNVA